VGRKEASLDSPPVSGAIALVTALTTHQTIMTTMKILKPVEQPMT
jgi:hypothetical protein